jgi:hypothetical protein
LASTLLVLTACPADDGGGDTGAMTMSTTMSATMTSADTDPTGGMTMTGMTMSGGETEPATESSGGGGSGPPVINSVSWTHAAGCMMNTTSDVEIVIEATDPDNDESELTFSGMVIGCTGMIEGATSTIMCPQLSTYTGDVAVEDPDGNSDDIEIMIEVCVDGSAMP